MNVEPGKTQRRAVRKKRKYVILAEPTRPGAAPVAPREGGPEDLEQAAIARFAKSRHELIAEVAYYKAERRGFVGGDPDRDWHEAEREVEELLRKGRPF